jgi:hypothetical protein
MSKKWPLECAFRQLPAGQQAAESRVISASLEATGVNIGAKTLHNAAKTAPGQRPRKPGGQLLSPEFERELADGVKFLRSEKQPVFMQDVIDAVEATIEGTEYADHFPNGVTTGWYYGWLERQGLRTGHMQPIEITRQKWLTSGNLKRYYEVLAAMLVKAGIARWNPDFDEDVPYSEVVLFIHPQRLTSHDETDTSLNADFSSKKNSNRGILDGRSDDGAVLGHKAGMKISATIGRTGAGEATPPYFCFASGKGWEPGWALGPPDADGVRHPPQLTNIAKDVHGVPLPAIYSHNATGAMNSEKCFDYMMKVTIPSMGGISAEEGRQGVEVLDGCSCHLDIKRLLKGKELGLMTALRVPCTTSWTQGKDSTLFRVLKPQFQSDKRRRLRAKVGRCRLTVSKPELKARLVSALETKM